ncbi:uncharacterized protein LOC116923796 [Daphnia magna]|uniref:Dendritic cell-specific transmembrane protein-like domain-containing protein n=1 Tax=Daphnia magna TaxID=35525 RepID=A0A164MNU5_9CRUS|nr:uncharacterized protein LOC116923796 [Daphnia magna]KZS05221.1 Uncharacterized protein APZ42_031653 [Daphnia magna]
MFCFTKINMLYAITVCFFFGVTVGAFVFVSRADQLCPTYMNNGTIGLCYVAVGAGAGGIAGLLWPFLPVPMHVYISLIATMTGGHVFNLQMTILTYVETMRVLSHIQKVTIVPLEVAECLKEETVYSMQLIRRSMFDESHVEDMNRGIKEVADSFDRAKQAQDEFRDTIETGFRWLESKGSTCTETLKEPYPKCLSDLQNSDSVNQLIMGQACESLRTLGTAPCGMFSEERITDSLRGIRDRIAAWISDAIRMRVGILFEMKATNFVEDELANAWAPFKNAMNTGSDLADYLYDFVTNYVLKYMGAFILIIWPFGYMLCYNRGPLEFDNVYIPEDEQEKEYNDTNDDTLDELRYLPLQSGIETKKIRMVPAWILNPGEIFKVIKSLIFVVDLLIILSVLLVDFYYTKVVDGMYFGSINLFNNYQGKIFDIVRLPLSDAKGIHYIGQILLEQLDSLQQAAGLGRMVACARRAPPIDYTYEVFALALLLRLYYLFTQIKLAWLPSMICARYNQKRHKQRMRSLKAKTLLRRDEYYPPSRFPWLNALFGSCHNFCSYNFTPSWLRTLMDAKDEFNL